MNTEPNIPFGYVRVFGQLQKGDGILDLDTGKFVKVRREHVEVIIKKRRIQWPCAKEDEVAIRRATVTQPLLPGVEAAANEEYAE